MYVQYRIQCVTILVQYGVPYLVRDLYGDTLYVFIECGNATYMVLCFVLAPYGVLHRMQSVEYMLL